MKKTLKIFVAVAIPMALASGGIADAAPKAAGAAKAVAQKGKKKGLKFGFLKALVKAGALPRAALDNLNKQVAKIRGCFQQARAAKKDGKSACRALRGELVKLQAAAYNQAKPKSKAHIAKVAKFKDWLKKRAERIKFKAAQAAKKGKK